MKSRALGSNVIRMSTRIPPVGQISSLQVSYIIPFSLIGVKRCMSSLLTSTSITDVDGCRRSVYYYDSDTASDLPPLLLIPGTCQTVSTWQPHIQELSKDRRLIIPELRCCGDKTALLPKITSLYDMVLDVEKFLQEIFAHPVVDVVGFSLGGRIALALAAYKPHVVKRLSVTGVPLERPPLGDIIIESWLAGLYSDEAFRGTAWSFVLNGFSEEYLKRNRRNIAHYVSKIYENNDYRNLKVLISQTHDRDDNAAAANCAHLISCPVQVISASSDRISDTHQEKRLSDTIENSEFVEIRGAGHLSPFEKPREWRGNVQRFMSTELH